MYLDQAQVFQHTIPTHPLFIAMAPKLPTRTSRIGTLLGEVDRIMHGDDGHVKIDPYDLLENGILHSESVRRDDKPVLVNDLLKEALSKHHHCIIGSLRVPFARVLFQAKLQELRDTNQRPIVKMHMREPRIVYFDTDLALVRRVLQNNKVMKERAVEATRKKATAALQDLDTADRMEAMGPDVQPAAVPAGEQDVVIA